MTDLERFFRHLVSTLVGIDSARPRQSLCLGDIRSSILPYRTHRRALQLESSEDYELLLMRLCAGEGGFAEISPTEVQASIRSELASPNPDLTLVERYGKATITLDSRAVSRILDHDPELVYAPGNSSQEPTAETGATSASTSVDAWQAPTMPDHGDRPDGCTRCGGTLPRRRVVNFCPHCGYNLIVKRCPDCAIELEPGWRHCVGCGRSISTG